MCTLCQDAIFSNILFLNATVELEMKHWLIDYVGLTWFSTKKDHIKQPLNHEVWEWGEVISPHIL